MSRAGSVRGSIERDELASCSFTVPLLRVKIIIHQEASHPSQFDWRVNTVYGSCCSESVLWGIYTPLTMATERTGRSLSLHEFLPPPPVRSIRSSRYQNQPAKDCSNQLRSSICFAGKASPSFESTLFAWVIDRSSIDMLISLEHDSTPWFNKSEEEANVTSSSGRHGLGIAGPCHVYILSRRHRAHMSTNE